MNTATAATTSPASVLRRDGSPLAIRRALVRAALLDRLAELEGELDALADRYDDRDIATFRHEPDDLAWRGVCADVNLIAHGGPSRGCEPARPYTAAEIRGGEADEWIIRLHAEAADAAKWYRCEKRWD